MSINKYTMQSLGAGLQAGRNNNQTKFMTAYRTILERIVMSQLHHITAICLFVLTACAPNHNTDIAPEPTSNSPVSRLSEQVPMTAEQETRASELSNDLYKRMQEFVYVFNAVEAPNQSVDLPSIGLGVPDPSIANVYLDRSGLYAATTKLKWTNHGRGSSMMFEVRLVHNGKIWVPIQTSAVSSRVGSTPLPLSGGAPNQEQQMHHLLERFFEELTQE